MAGGTFVIFGGDETWRVRSGAVADELRIERGTPAKTIATSVAAKLRERGYQGQGVLLALPAGWCLAATVSTADLPRQDRAALAFRLEEKLPLAAEHFTADFVSQADGRRALGVCAANERVVPIVEALEAAGVVVQSVTPAAMLAVQAATERNPALLLVLWAEENGVNVIGVEGGRPAFWAVTLAEEQALGMQIDVAMMEMEDATVVARDLGDDWVRWLRVRTGQDVTARRESIEDAVVRRAAEVLGGTLVPWVELRRGALEIEDPLRLVRRPINAALAAAAVFCIVLAGVFVYRAIRYDRLAQTYEAQLADEFTREFPGWPVPPNVRRMVESERAKLTGAGLSSSSLPAEAQASALKGLHDVLANLPADTKMTIERINIYDTVAEVAAGSKVHADGEVLAGAMRAAGFQVPTPATRQQGDGWSFVVRGDKPVKAAAAAAAGGEE